MENTARKLQNTDLEIVAHGQKIIDAEAQALALLARGLGKSFSESVNLILQMSGSQRIVCSGVGKAGFVAEKLAATLSSIGSASFALNPLSALHGDIGSAKANDIAILFSNTGETAEVLQLGFALKSLDLSIICITCNISNSLAQIADHVISIGKIEEAGPLQLAPTTSTLAMLSVADALAMTVLAYKKFTKEDFLRLHPAGLLGRKLLAVSAIMRSGEKLCTVTADESCRTVIHKISMTPGKPGAAVIVDSKNKLLGIFTDGDLRRCLDSSSNFLDEPVSQYMGKNPKSILPSTKVADALAELSKYDIDQILVCDENNKLLGLVDIQDTVRL